MGKRLVIFHFRHYNFIIYFIVSLLVPVAHNVYVNVLSNFHIHQVLGTVHLTCRGGYGFLLRLEIFFRTTRELELFFCRAKRAIFFPELTLGYMTKTLNQIFFFPPPKSEYFFQQHWESEYFFQK